MKDEVTTAVHRQDGLPERIPTSEVCRRLCARYLIMAAFLLILLSGCSRPVAVVNGKEIPKKEYTQDLRDKRLTMAGQRQHAEDITVKNIVIDALIEKYLILEEAGKKGITVTDDEVRKESEAFRGAFKTVDDYSAYLKQREMTESDLLKRLRDRLVMNRFIFTLRDMSSVSIDEVRAAYEANKPLAGPATYRISMIEFTDAGKAKDVAERIRKTSFEKVARGLSPGQGVVAVTTPQWVKPSYFSGELSDILLTARLQSVIGPLQRGGSWYVIQLHERRDAQYRTFDEVKEAIMFNLLHQRRLLARDEWLKAKKEEAKIIVYPGRL